MSTATLLKRHTFGLSPHVKDNILYVDADTVCYVAGHNVVVSNVEARTQRFIVGDDSMDTITAIAVSPRRDVIAVAECGEKAPPRVSIYDTKTLKRRKVLNTGEVQAKMFVHLCFSPDGKELLTMGGEPDWILVKWLWEKAKIQAHTRTTQRNEPVFQVSFCPVDPTCVCVCGQNFFRFFRVQDTFKPMPKPMHKAVTGNYLCHAWVGDERVIVGTETGDLLLVEQYECKSQPLLHSPSDGHAINCVAAHPSGKGFICAGDGAAVHLFEKCEDHDSSKAEREYYRRTATVKLPDTNNRILNMAFSDESVVVQTADSQLLSVSLQQAERSADSGGGADDTNAEKAVTPLTEMYHQKGIVGLDTCLRKPLVATCSTDRSVRIWNYKDNRVELQRDFAEEAFSIAFHPSGLHVLVGFSDKLRLMNLLIDDIRIVKEFPIKACRECQFSNGGQYFAAVNSAVIQIFNTYTCENVGSLRGHNGKVRSMSWTPDDMKLVSAGLDGAVYEWKIKEFKRDAERDNVLKACQYTSVVCSADAHSIFAVGSDQKLKEIVDSQTAKEFYYDDCCLTQVCLSHSGRMLFAATDSGSIRSYKFPLTGEFNPYECHGGPVTRLRMSHNDDYLFSVSEDACLYVFDVRDGSHPGHPDRLPPAEEILITRSDLEDKTQKMKALENKVGELVMANEYQMRLRDIAHQDHIKELTDNSNTALEDARGKYELLRQEKNDMEMDYEERLKAAEEKHSHEKNTMDATHQGKIMAEVERFHALQQEKELMNERWDEQNSLLVESHEQVVQQMTEEYESKIQALAEALEQGKEDREDLIRQFEETTKQIEQDADREIEELKESYETKLNQEREIALRLKGDNTLKNKKTQQMQRDIDDHKEDIETMHQKEKELRRQITTHEKDIRGQRQEIRERDETIGDKEKRIFDLKRKNQELEKFKFVLEYKIEQLKEQVEPKQHMIAQMKEQINKMDQELERYHKNNSNLELQISDLRLKLKGVQGELKLQRNRAKDAEQYIQRFKTEVHEVVAAVQEPKVLKEGVKLLYQKYCQKEGTDQIAVEEEADVASEYARQRDYLEKTVNSLKRKLAKDTDRHRVESMRIMQENVALIKEINELRREMKAMKAQAQAERLAGTSMGGGSNRGPGGDASKEVLMQREQIRQLRERLEQLDNQRPGSQMSSRPGSRERLPPMSIGENGEAMLPLGLEGTERPRSARSRSSHGSRPTSASHVPHPPEN